MQKSKNASDPPDQVDRVPGPGRKRELYEQYVARQGATKASLNSSIPFCLSLCLVLFFWFFSFLITDQGRASRLLGLRTRLG